MVKTFKLRYVNEIVGVFVLIAMGFVIFGIVLALRGQGWLTRAQSLQIRILLPEEGSMGLKPGDNVQVLGTVIGSVDTINFNKEEQRMEATIRVRGDLIDYLKTDSIPVLHSSFGIGASYMEIRRSAQPPTPEHPSLPLPKTDARLWYSEADNGPSEKVTAILNQVQEQAVPALQEARAAIREYTALAADLRNPDKPLQQTIAHLNEITGSITKGEGLVGRLLNDPKMAEQISVLLPRLNAAFDEMQGVLKNLGKTSGNLADLTESAREDMKRLPVLLDTTKDTIAELQVTLKDIRKTTAKLPEMVEGATVTINTLPGVVLQMQETLRQVQILVEGAQKSWLFRSNIEKSDPIGRVRAEDLGK